MIKRLGIGDYSRTAGSGKAIRANKKTRDKKKVKGKNGPSDKLIAAREKWDMLLDRKARKIL